MNRGKFVSTQPTSYITRYEFDKYVLRNQGDFKVQDFNCWYQFLCMMFGQLKQILSVTIFEKTQ